jgi:ubiquinone/menaquinone biosynthesis C-methylase UbiE
MPAAVRIETTAGTPRVTKHRSALGAKTGGKMTERTKRILAWVDRVRGLGLRRGRAALAERWRRAAPLNAIRRCVWPLLVQSRYRMGLDRYDKRPLKLHLGCGPHHFDGYVNIDLRMTQATDLVCSITKLPYPDRSVARIETYHVIEHLFRHDLPVALREWYRLLIPGGQLVIEFPDLDQLMRKYLAGDIKQLDGIFGLQRFEGDCHHFGYTFDTLRNALEKDGFVQIERKEPEDYHAEEWDCIRIECVKPLTQDATTRPSGTANDLFTGERVVEGITPERIWVDHVARYEFAGAYVPGKKVLDIACGTGFGSSILLRCGASEVLGEDISSEAIEFARSRYSARGIRFEVGDLLHMDLPRDSFDVIACFETIEHVAAYGEALSNLFGLLKKGGTLLVASPNRPVTSPSAVSLGDKPANPYHTQEFTVAELQDALTKTGFRIAPGAVFGQRQALFFRNRLFRRILRWFWRQETMSSPAVIPVGRLCPRYFLLVATK